MHEDGSEDVFDIAIHGGMTKEGKKRYQAIGGGAKLSQEAIVQLREEFPSIRFREGEESDDARFYLPLPDGATVEAMASEEQQAEANDIQNAFVHSVLDRFSEQNPALFEASSEREFMEELTESKLGQAPVLTEDDVRAVQIKYEGVISPIQWGARTSARAGSAGGYYRLFHLFDIAVSEEIFAKMQASPLIKILSEEDKLAIRQSTESGEAAAQLADGSIVVENIFPAF